MSSSNEHKASLTLAFLAAAATNGAAAAQDGPAIEPTPLEPERTFTPVSSVDPSANPRTEERGDQVVSEPNHYEAAPGVPVKLDDSIPLPVRAVMDEVDGVDVVVQEASGDPYFLGFVGGNYYPPADEILDPALIAAAGTGSLDARPDAVTYGFVMFSKRITPERRQTLERLGCRILGFHPHYTVKVALPTSQIGEVSVQDFVRWVGVARPEQKVHPRTGDFIDLTPAGERTPLYVSVFEGDDMAAATERLFGTASSVDPGKDEVLQPESRSKLILSNGWMQAALAEVGVEVDSYAPRQRTFKVMALPEHVEQLAGLDFVQFVEPIGEAKPTAAPAPAPFHDESRAMIASDRLNTGANGGTNQTVVMGVVDSGIETAHDDLSIFGWGWNCTTESSPWDDIAGNSMTGHGTHVAGTLFGRGVAEADHLGNAPGLGSWSAGRVFNYRRFPNPCSVGLDVIADRFANTVTSGGVVTRKPHIVNNSWRTSYGGPHSGTEFEARVSDDAVFDEDQLWVWAADNEGPGASTVSAQGAAKNSFVVGNVVDYISPSVGDPGNLWTSSSRGPTSDGRWKPNISAPGNQIRSCISNDNDGYAGYSGTSMAAPHVAGAAALLMDRYATLRDQPERIQALLMATAQTNDNVTLTSPTSTHLDQYGAGRMNAYKAAFNFGGNTYSTWTWENNGANWNFADFTVPAGCTRIVAVMTSLETSASAGASSALINDWDFYLDRDPIDPAGDTGEYFAQQSSIDNCEIRMINNPPEGLWRWKVYPDSVTSTTKIGVCIHFVVDDTTPDATLTLSADDSYIQPNENVDVTANVDVDDYVASAVVLDRSGTSASLQGATSTLGDGTVTDLTDNWSGGQDLTLGDIIDFYDRAGTWTLRYSTEGTKTVSVEARSDNMVDKNASISIVVDGTQPGAVGSLQSTSHTTNQWSNDPTITYTWNPAFDGLSGIDGYGIFETSSAAIPGTILDIGAVSTYTSAAFPSSTLPRYFNIRSVDRSGNWDADFRSAGPYFIDVTEPGLPSLASASHPINTERCENTITVDWTAASDAHSGVEGYGLFWSASATGSPSNVLDTTGTSDTITLPAGTWYLKIKTVDQAGNWSSGFESFGPFIIGADCGEAYCTAVANSTGVPAQLRALGTDDASANDLTIEAFQLPNNTFGLLATSLAPGFTPNPPNSSGNLCLGGAIGRYNADIMNSGATGSFQIDLNLVATPTSTGFTTVTAGQTRFWQVWYRDANPTPTSNFTRGLRVLFY